MLLLTAMTLRAAHFLGGVPWSEALWTSPLAQAALSIVWTIAGIAAMLLGKRRGSRAVWIGGGALMGVVIVKLLLIDRQHLQDLTAIVGRARGRHPARRRRLFRAGAAARRRRGGGMKKWLCILLAFAAAAAQADTRDYAYAWTIVPDVGGPAYQVELTPEVYAALTTNDLRDFDVVNNKGESVPTALYRPAVAAPRSPLVALPMFTVPAPPSETAAAGDDAIHLHIERGPGRTTQKPRCGDGRADSAGWQRRRGNRGALAGCRKRCRSSTIARRSSSTPAACTSRC